jgi:hypothetical protein
MQHISTEDYYTYGDDSMEETLPVVPPIQNFHVATSKDLPNEQYLDSNRTDSESQYSEEYEYSEGDYTELVPEPPKETQQKQQLKPVTIIASSDVAAKYAKTLATVKKFHSYQINTPKMKPESPTFKSFKETVSSEEIDSSPNNTVNSLTALQSMYGENESPIKRSPIIHSNSTVTSPNVRPSTRKEDEDYLEEDFKLAMADYEKSLTRSSDGPVETGSIVQSGNKHIHSPIINSSNGTEIFIHDYSSTTDDGGDTDLEEHFERAIAQEEQEEIAELIRSKVTSNDSRRIQQPIQHVHEVRIVERNNPDLSDDSDDDEVEQKYLEMIKKERQAQHNNAEYIEYDSDHNYEPEEEVTTTVYERTTIIHR